MIAIQATNLSKKYDIYAKASHRLLEFLSLGRKKYHKEFWSLKNLSFTIEKGQTVGILGANGSGKSTLLKLISGITYPTEGSVETHGRIASLIELGMGFHPEFSGRANVYLNASLMGMRRQEIDRKLDSILDFSGMHDFIDHPTKTYSSGMYVRLAFSIAISVDPDIFLVDEALAVGDALFQRRCLKKIQEFQQKGVTMLFVSHDLTALKVLCKQVILLDRGRILEMGDSGAVIDRYTELVAQREAKFIKSIKAGPAPSSVPVSGNLKAGRRYGSFEAKILNVQLLNQKGEERAAFVSGEEVTIRVTSLVLNPIESLTVGVVVRTRHGLEVFGTNTYHKNILLEKCKEGEEITASFQQALPLTPGNYFITTALHSQDTHYSACYDWWDDATVLKILPGASTFSGIVDLDPEVTVHKNSLDPSAFQEVLTKRVFPDAPSTLAMDQESSSKFLLCGWYDTEQWNGEIVRWTDRTPVALLRGEKKFSHIYFRAFASNPNLARQPLTGTIHVDDQPCGSFELKDAKWTEVSLPLSRQVEGIAKIKIVLDRTWSPQNSQHSNSNKELGMAVERIGFS